VQEESFVAPRRPLTWVNGGWLLGLLALASIGAMASLLVLWPRHRGDGQNPETYGFDLRHTVLTPGGARIVAGGMPRDYLQALDDPEMITPAQVERLNTQGHYNKFLLPQDRIIGVVIGGAARAYPIKSMVYHEVVNDTVGSDGGGQPIVVTYSALCDSTAVFERTLGGHAVRFGVSGLLYNSNLLFYDRIEGGVGGGDGPAGRVGGESLWSQLEARALAGPRAGETLQLLPCAVVRWENWLAEHPDTRVMAPNPQTEKLLGEISYATYYASDQLKFPVEPAWKDRGLPAKTPVLAIRIGAQDATSRWKVFVLPRLDALTEAQRRAVLDVPGVRLSWYPGDSHGVPPALETDGTDSARPITCVYSFIFAFNAAHLGAYDLVP